MRFYELGQVLKITVVKIGAALGPTLIPLLKGLAEGIADITKKIENLGGGLTILGAQIKLTLVEMLLAVFEQIADILNQLPGSLGVMFGAVVKGLRMIRTQAQKDLTAAQRAAQDRPGDEEAGGVKLTNLQQQQGLGITGVSTNMLSGFAAGMAGLLGDPSQADPKKEEKEMVGLLEEIADAGPLAVQPG